MGLTKEQLLELGAKPVQTGSVPSTTPTQKFTKEQLLQRGAKPVGQAAPAAQQSPVPEAPQEEQPTSMLGRGANAINKVYEKYSQNPVVRGLSNIVGVPVAAAGGVIGGVVGGVGGVVRNIAKGRPLGENLGRDISQTAKETAGFGHQIGQEGAIAAPLGGAGKIVNAVVGAPQIYQGAKDVYAGTKKQIAAGAQANDFGGAEQAAEGAMSLGLGLIGARGAFKEPTILPNVRGYKEGVTAFGRGVKQKLGATDEARLNKAETEFRKTIGQTSKQARNEQKGRLRAAKTGVEEKNTPRFLMEEGLVPSEVRENGRMVFNTDEARKTLQERLTKANDIYEAALDRANPHKRHDLEMLKRSAMNSVEANSAEQKTVAQEKIAKAFDAEIGRHGQVVNDSTLNKIKRGFYDQGRYDTMPDSSKAYRKAGEFLNHRIQEVNKGELSIEEANKVMGNYLEGDKLLSDIHGTGVKGGALGRRLSGIMGGIIGTAQAGPVGGAVGYAVGERVNDAMISPERRLGKYRDTFAGKRASEATMEKLKSEPPALEAERNQRKMLLAPPLKVKTPEIKQPTQAEIKERMRQEGKMTDAYAKVVNQINPTKKIRSGDFSAEDVTLFKAKNGQFYVFRKGYSPTAISKQEAFELQRTGKPVEDAGALRATSLAKAMQQTARKIASDPKLGGETFNIDGSKYEGQNAIVTLYSKTLKANEVTPDMIQKILDRKPFDTLIFDADTYDLIKPGVFDMGNGEVSVDINLETPSRPFAEHVARMNNQKAYYDAETGEAPSTEGTGKQKLAPQNIVNVIRQAKAFNESSRAAAESAKKYMEKSGMKSEPNNLVLSLDKENSKRIADAFEAMKDDPTDPKVLRSYEALAQETKAQWDQLIADGFKMEPWYGEGQPYKNSAEMVADVKKKHIYFFPTEAGFGKGTSPNHPLLKESGVIVNGVNLKYNDLFRAVHDVFGHAAVGNQFGPLGEENAWRKHSEMFSDDARRAMTTETRGQNSWVNFGKHMRSATGLVPKEGEPGFVSLKDRAYAEQKTGLLPDEFVFPDSKQQKLPFGKPPEKGPGQPKEEYITKFESSSKNENFIGKNAKTFKESEAKMFPDKNLKNVIEADIKYKPELAAWLRGHSWNVGGRRLNAGISLRDAIDYPALFEAYPSAKNIKVKVIRSDRIGGSMEVKPNGAVTIELAEGRSIPDTVRTIKHELQHYIQAKEAWSKGGSRMAIYNPDVQYMTLLRMRRNVLGSEKALGVATIKDMQRIERMIKKTGDGTALSKQEVKDVFGSGEAFVEQAMLTYGRLYGEAEARGEIKDSDKYIFTKRSQETKVLEAIDSIPEKKSSAFGNKKGQAFDLSDPKFMYELTRILNRENKVKFQIGDIKAGMFRKYKMGKLDTADLMEFFDHAIFKDADHGALVSELVKALKSSEGKPGAFGKK